MNVRYNQNFDIAVNDFGAKKSARCNLVIVKSGPSVYPIFHHDIYKVDYKHPLVSKTEPVRYKHPTFQRRYNSFVVLTVHIHITLHPKCR